MRDKVIQEGGDAIFSFYCLIRISKTKYFENRFSTLRTIFCFEILVSRYSKLDPKLIVSINFFSLLS
jgi:hypothetical protein